MTMLEGRLRKLEARHPSNRTNDLLRPLSKKDMTWLCQELGKEKMERVLLMCASEAGPNVLETYRGKVEDSLIQGAYNQMRNWVLTEPWRTIVRRRAGVIDERGGIVKGYVLCDNGCINDAE